MSVNKIAMRMMVFLSALQLAQSLRGGYRPKPGTAFWMSQQDDQEDIYSLEKQDQSEFSDNDEISEIK